MASINRARFLDIVSIEKTIKVLRYGQYKVDKVLRYSLNKVYKVLRSIWPKCCVAHSGAFRQHNMN